MVYNDRGLFACFLWVPHDAGNSGSSNEGGYLDIPSGLEGASDPIVCTEIVQRARFQPQWAVLPASQLPIPVPLPLYSALIVSLYSAVSLRRAAVRV
jgi:hypothetical protein